MPSGDCKNIGGVPRNDKENDKQSDKKTLTDPMLARVVDAWSDRPDAARTVILATVEAYHGKGE